MAKDMVNSRVDAAQAEIAKRAARLRDIVSRPGKKSPAFEEGAKLLADMIEQESKMLDVMVFDAPKTAIEQQRNLMLMTGKMNQTPVEGIVATTGAMDGMLDILDAMSKQR